MKPKKVIILATKGLTTNLLFNELSNHFDGVEVIIENKISKIKILKNRAKKIGWFKVIGQIFFILIIPKFLSIFSKTRINEIIKSNALNQNQIPESVITKVESINDMVVLETIQTLNPDLIFVNGTRIIGKSILSQIKTPFINIHVGITPKYRGVHGGYWALYNDDPKLFGVTLHYVDSGIDTGKIIEQKTINISEKDNFYTYPILQFSNGVDLLRKYISDLDLKEKIQKAPLTKENNLFYHPTIFEYLKKRVLNKVK